MPDFLAKGLCIFWDAAYINTMSLAAKDSYNYFHLQLWIRIECVFGMLAHCWATLWMPLLHKFTIEKVASLVYCLCKLHNFCIDQYALAMQPHMPDFKSNVVQAQGKGICLNENMLLIGQQTGIPCNLWHFHNRQIVSPLNSPCYRIIQQIIDSGMVWLHPTPLRSMTHS